jgi:two-component system, LytTR family, response regulator
MELQSALPKLTAIIVDDELHGRENLKLIIENYCPDIDIKDCADSVVTATAMVKKSLPDVVFLDINMPVLDGFDFLNEFTDRQFMVVFVSAHEEFGIEAVKVGAVDYLLKPINIKELKLCVKKLIALKEKNNEDLIKVTPDKLVVPASHGFNVIPIADIIRLQADGCYTTIITNDKKQHLISRTLKDIEASLPKDFFFRTHKSNLINLSYIKDYSNLSGNFVTMTDGSKIDISRRKAPEFIHRVKAFLNTI